MWDWATTRDGGYKAEPCKGKGSNDLCFQADCHRGLRAITLLQYNIVAQRQLRLVTGTTLSRRRVVVRDLASNDMGMKASDCHAEVPYRGTGSYTSIYLTDMTIMQRSLAGPAFFRAWVGRQAVLTDTGRYGDPERSH